MTDLYTALTIAITAHDGDVDKGGQPYILHPLRVMLRMDTDEERVVAVLHDVLEDHPQMRVLIPQGYIPALEVLTRRKGETYAEYIERVRQDPLATKVKIADLRDNLDPKRLSLLSAEDLSLVPRYGLALIRLLREGEGNGHPTN